MTDGYNDYNYHDEQSIREAESEVINQNGAGENGAVNPESDVSRKGPNAEYTSYATYSYETGRTNQNMSYGGNTGQSNMNAGSTGNNNANRYTPYPGMQYGRMDGGVPGDKQKKKGGFMKKALVCLAMGLIFGVFAGAGLYVVHLFSGEKQTADAPQQAIQEVQTTGEQENTLPAGAKEKTTAQKSDQILTTVTATDTGKTTSGTMAMDVSGVVDEVMPAVVAITNNYTMIQQDWFGQRYKSSSEASGSGIIIGKSDTELLIVTNAHVVSSAESLYVQFIDETSAEARLKGKDESNDLAVIAVDLGELEDDTLKEIKIATLGDSDKLKVGQATIAIGNALGYGQSVTTGVVSAVNREVSLSNGSHKLIQTDAAINPGNSGGALLDINGNVIGVNEAKLAGGSIEGMGYAIPISTARPVIERLMNKDTKDILENHGYLGISGADVSAEVAEQYNVPQGVYVAKVEKGLAADKAGLKKGDIITGFDGQSVQTMEELQELLQYYPVGAKAEMTLYTQNEKESGYSEKTVEVTLSEYAAASDKGDSGKQDGDENSSDNNQQENIQDYYGNFGDFFRDFW
ncbi:MAG: trypsin-like peptidase domain-containing protein [Lachnospiraceae bacterium]|nr:trypsin-like peptidase domain-containing protein [Lachnospiraceae bacterium]